MKDFFKRTQAAVCLRARRAVPGVVTGFVLGGVMYVSSDRSFLSSSCFAVACAVMGASFSDPVKPEEASFKKAGGTILKKAAVGLSVLAALNGAGNYFYEPVKDYIVEKRTNEMRVQMLSAPWTPTKQYEFKGYGTKPDKVMMVDAVNMIHPDDGKFSRATARFVVQVPDFYVKKDNEVSSLQSFGPRTGHEQLVPKHPGTNRPLSPIVYTPNGPKARETIAQPK